MRWLRRLDVLTAETRSQNPEICQNPETCQNREICPDRLKVDQTRFAAEPAETHLLIVGEADRFLYRMMRMLSGSLVQVGRGIISPTQLKAILDARVRTDQMATAPPNPL